MSATTQKKFTTTPRKDRSFEVNGKTYRVLFSSNAMYLLEKVLQQNIGVIGLLLMTGKTGFMELQTILWAGLEGARIKFKEKRAEWTLYDVGDLIDELDGPTNFWHEDSPAFNAVLDAWAQAFPKKDESDPPAQTTAEGDSDKSPTEAVSTGTDSSIPQQESASAKSDSGT